LGVKTNGTGKAAMIPGNLGRLYYLHGYQQHKNILLDLLDLFDNGVAGLISTNAPARVEVIVKDFSTNVPEHLHQPQQDGRIVHLINLTGYSNTYFEPLPVRDISVRLKCDFEPESVVRMSVETPIEFEWRDGFVTLKLSELRGYEAVVLMR